MRKQKNSKIKLGTIMKAGVVAAGVTGCVYAFMQRDKIKNLAKGAVDKIRGNEPDDDLDEDDFFDDDFDETVEVERDIVLTEQEDEAEPAAKAEPETKTEPEAEQPVSDAAAETQEDNAPTEPAGNT